MSRDRLTEAHRRRAAESALASVALDGLQPDQYTRDLLEEAARGGLSTEQLYQLVLDHARAGDP